MRPHAVFLSIYDEDPDSIYYMDKSTVADHKKVSQDFDTIEEAMFYRDNIMDDIKAAGYFTDDS